MRVLIAETEKIETLSYVCDGIDYAAEIVGNYTKNQIIDVETDATIMLKDDFEYWQDAFSKYAFYDNLIDYIEYGY